MSRSATEERRRRREADDKRARRAARNCGVASPLARDRWRWTRQLAWQRSRDDARTQLAEVNAQRKRDAEIHRGGR